MAKVIHSDGRVEKIGQDCVPPGRKQLAIPAEAWASTLERTHPKLYEVVVRLVAAGESKGDIMAAVTRAGATPLLTHCAERTIEHLRQH